MSTQRASDAPLLTPAEVAAIFRVEKSTVSRWASEGLIRPVRVGRTVRFRQDEVERLLGGAA